jgi:predicted ArsR family transcriptional regulator
MAMTATLQEQARALGDPTRHGIFRYVADADRPVDVAELTEFFGFNHNAIRQHLAKLVDAGLVTEDRAPSTGRGRPRLVYRVNPAAESRWGVTGPYERLSLLLVEILRSGKSAVEVGRRSVRRRGLGSGAKRDPAAAVVEAMERQGFDPVLRSRGTGIELVLRNCPFESAALADSDTVCAIHLGIAQGVAALSDGRLVVDELVPHDPRKAHCQLRMHLESETARTRRAP